jgi:hypothetical protein
MELQKSERGYARRAFDKAVMAFSGFKKDPEVIRTGVLAKHGPLLETAKREIFDTKGVGSWSWQHFRRGWKLGEPEVAKKDRSVFARELIEQVAAGFAKTSVDQYERHKQAVTLFYGVEEYGIQKEISDAAARVIFKELLADGAPIWPSYDYARSLAKKRGWKTEAREVAGKKKAFEAGLTYLGSVTDPGFEERRERLSRE